MIINAYHCVTVNGDMYTYVCMYACVYEYCAFTSKTLYCIACREGARDTHRERESESAKKKNE